MPRDGYTLVELLVVISMMAILGVIAFVNFKDFSSDQVAKKAVGQIQSALKQAQTNATAGITCGVGVSTTWYAKLNTTGVDINCLKSDRSIDTQKSYILENATLSIKCSASTSNLTLPVNLTYAPLNGQVIFTGDPGELCLNTTKSLVITVINSRSTISSKVFTISKGGGIDVQ